MPRQRSCSPKRSNKHKLSKTSQDEYRTFWESCKNSNIESIKNGLSTLDPTYNHNAALEYVLKSQYDDEEKVDALKNITC